MSYENNATRGHLDLLTLAKRCFVVNLIKLSLHNWMEGITSYEYTNIWKIKML